MNITHDKSEINIELIYIGYRKSQFQMDSLMIEQVFVESVQLHIPVVADVVCKVRLYGETTRLLKIW